MLQQTGMEFTVTAVSELQVYVLRLTTLKLLFHDPCHDLIFDEGDQRVVRMRKQHELERHQLHLAAKEHAVMRQERGPCPDPY